MSEDCVIEVSHLVTEIAGNRIHDGIDLCVHPAEVLALIGGSGSGKTTLLRLMLGLETPTQGEIRVLGCSLTGCSPESLERTRLHWGMLFQEGALFSALSVFDNVALPLRELKTIPKDIIRELVYLKLAQVGIEAKHGTKMPAELSGGMVKRVALARALALDPDLLFLDEPTAGLDPDRSKAFVQLIEALRRELKFTVVMVTHDLDTLIALADRVAVLADRKLVAMGPLWEVAESQHPFIRNFFLGHKPRCAESQVKQYRDRLSQTAMTV